jgi:streptogramin lyase
MPLRKTGPQTVPVTEPPLHARASSVSYRPLLVTGGLIAVTAAFLTIVLSRGGESPRGVSVPPPSRSSLQTWSGPATGALLRIDPKTNEVSGMRYAVGKDPSAVAVGEGSVWVANGGDKSIVRLDPATGKAQATVVLDQPPRGIAIGGSVSGVWVTTVFRVSKIDPLSNDVVLMQDLGEPTGAVTSGEGSVWVTGLFFGLGRVDPATGLLDSNFFVGEILCSVCGQADVLRHANAPWSGDHRRGAAPSIAAGLGSIWAVGAPPPSGPSAVWRIDPSTGSSTPIRVPFGAISVAVGKNVVWAVGTNGEVVRIDPRAKRVVKRIETGNGATEVVAGLGAVWVLNPTLGTLTRIDPGTNAAVATIAVGRTATALAVGEGSVWVTRRAG